MSRLSEGVKLKIHEGTGRLTGEPLCHSCTHVLRRNDDVFCALWGERERIRKAVFSCNKYYSASLPSLGDMKEVAWELKTSKGRVVGFRPPKPSRGEAPWSDDI